MKLISKKLHSVSFVKYDLEVQNNHSFVANGVVVHNSNVRFVYHNGSYHVKSRNRWLKRQPDYSHLTVEFLTKQGCDPQKAEEMVARLANKESPVNSFWQHLEREEKLLQYLRDNPGTTVFGEIYGNTNRLKYGLPEVNRFAAFDIYRDGCFVSAGSYSNEVYRFGIPSVPVLADAVPYTFDYVKQLATGKTTVPGSTVIREGAVVRPLVERYARGLGRVILKSVSPEFLQLKG